MITESRLSRVRCQEERVQQSLTPQADQADYAFAILSEYSEVQDTHDLFHTDLHFEDIPLSIDEALAALSDSSLEPTVELDDEPSWAQALPSPKREFWIAGGHEELKSLEDLKVFVLVPCLEVPHGHHPLKGKLICKQKRNDTGKVVHYKVRYVAKGFTQHWGINYNKTTAPTIRLESFHSILHITATNDWDLQQFDIKMAFLHGILPKEETMFMEQPKGFETPGKEDWVMHLMKSIYGMKQASQIWNQTFHNAVTQWGFKHLECKWCIYCCQSPSDSDITIFVVYVNNILSTSSNPDNNLWFHDKLKDQWDISNLRPPKFALGIAITHDQPNCLISLSQTAKVNHLVEQYNQGDAHPVDTPMVAELQLHRLDKSLPIPPKISDWIEHTPYCSLVGSLMYLAIATRPDITYAAG